MEMVTDYLYLTHVELELEVGVRPEIKRHQERQWSSDFVGSFTAEDNANEDIVSSKSSDPQTPSIFLGM